MNESGHPDDVRTPLVLALLHAAQALEHRLEDAFADVGLSTARYGVLAQLDRAGEPIPLGTLAERLSCVRSNITQLVDRLEADGLVRRIADPSDRRCVLAELTPAGRERAMAGAARLREVQATFDGSLSTDDRATLERIVAALA
ncbi:MAG TPA: MarR family transcriptional regulator [Longimicrobiales bacterium]